MRKKVIRLVSLIVICFILSECVPYCAIAADLGSMWNKDSVTEESLSMDEMAVSQDEVFDEEDVSNIDYSTLKINYNSDYSKVIYDSDSGLNSIEINCIAQTPDGYIYAGSYAGLYRYDGITFKGLKLDMPIANVMCLYVDSTGRLWVGTNDKGVVVFDPKTNEYVQYSIENGLAANSVRSIVEDQNGNYYVGTSSYLCRITDSGKVESFENMPEVTFVTGMITSYEGVIYGVTNEGGLFSINEDNISDTQYFYDSSILCGGLDQLGNRILVGTLAGDILSFDKNNLNSYEVYAGSEQIGNITYIDKIKCGDSGGCYICGENGFGYYDVNGNFQNFIADNFQGAVSDVLIDYQNNVWFSSTKYGICKMAYNSFSDMFQMVGLRACPVNGITKRDDYLFAATDNGLIVINEKTKKVENIRNLKALDSIRIRDAYKDSEGSIWFSAYDSNGIIKYAKDGKVTTFGEADGALGTKYRSTLELSDGTIAEASNLGITLIKNDVIVGTIGENEGMIVPQILCMAEDKKGRLLAGSDGDGIYVIKDGKIVDNIGTVDGLGSQVVLRIVPTKDGFIYVGSDSLYYDDGTEIIKLTSFPYNNNYDVLITDDGSAWVSSSAGIFVVNIDELIGNGEYDYVLFDKYNGFDTTLVANSWNYFNENSEFYICCSTGVRKLDINDYGKSTGEYNIYVNETDCDDVETVLPVNTDRIVIPSKVNRVSLSLSVLNFTMTNPLVRVSLVGFDDTGLLMRQSDLKDISFTNIPGGEYTLNIQILDEVDRQVAREINIPFVKETEFYEKAVFKIYLCTVIILILFATAWLFAKYGSVNELKYQYSETRKAKEEAENANQAKSQFLAKMSHEVRTPINAILGMNNLILQENISDTVTGYANDINSAATSLLSMVNDILDFSKIESQKMHLVEGEYNEKNFIENMKGILSANAKSKGLEWQVNVDKNIPSTLYGDSGRIRQILLNLLSNAVKYTLEGKVTLDVIAELEDENNVRLKYRVSDTGIGIKEEDISKLFNSFERVDEERNASIQGTGLGLAITKELADMMGGKIEVESEYGKGTVFTFSVLQKIISSEKIADNKPEKRKPLFTAPNVRMLVVDDNSINRKVVKGILKGIQCTIDQAASGRECLEMVKTNHYDVILLDHMMPEMDGIEVLGRLKDMEEFNQDIPVIALTANATEGARDQYLDYGFTDYITKPVNAEALETMLLKYLPPVLVERQK